MADTNSIIIKIVDSIEEAPHYGAGTPLLFLTKAIIVGKSTVADLPTVDLKMIDGKGTEYVLMTTGRIIEVLADAIRAKRENDASKS